MAMLVSSLGVFKNHFPGFNSEQGRWALSSQISQSGTGRQKVNK